MSTEMVQELVSRPAPADIGGVWDWHAHATNVLGNYATRQPASLAWVTLATALGTAITAAHDACMNGTAHNVEVVELYAREIRAAVRAYAINPDETMTRVRAEEEGE